MGQKLENGAVKLYGPDFFISWKTELCCFNFEVIRALMELSFFLTLPSRHIQDNKGKEPQGNQSKSRIWSSKNIRSFIY